MKKQELLNYFDDELLDKLFGFCYARTNDSHEAEELCSDILLALVKAANTDGKIEQIYPFIWRVARNVYADFSEKRRSLSDQLYGGDTEELLQNVAEESETDDTKELLTAVYRRIAFLTKAYREVMILFYLEGKSTAEIARILGVAEGTVRQRLFSARQKIRNEVEEMTDTCNNKPVALDKVDFVIWGTGDPSWGDPRNVFTRLFSKHILRLCHEKPMSPSEIAEKLNVPTIYVEEEIEILRKGQNKKYGLLRRLENGKYAINFVLFDKTVFEKANELYVEQLPKICDIIADFVEKHKEEYLAFPYLNRKVDMNLILWQQVFSMADAFSHRVEQALREKHFADTTPPDRPFSVYGYVDNGKYYGGGWDGVNAYGVCGFKDVYLDNIYITRIKRHFSCGHNVATDLRLQLALRAIEGLDVSSLNEEEAEAAAKAIACGYLYREVDMLYTKILVCTLPDRKDLFKISDELNHGYFDKDAEIVAEKVAGLIRDAVPEYLHGEWRYANRLASSPVIDAVVEALIERGLLMPPEDGVGAEGCWMAVEK